MKFARPTVFLTVLILFILSIPVTSSAQVRPIYDEGAVGLGQLLKRLNNTKRIMHIGAHPDDEDSDLLAYLARKENARVVYLSLTRGDGGQNVIGPELFEALGVIRTEELLQARTLDGAEQMFTRAFDYGFSKTLDEARRFWDEEKIKCDVVRAIRAFRPQVVNPRFSGTSADGHGQHQFAGYIAPIAVKAAADRRECPGTGDPWKVQKVYVGQSFRSSAEPSLSMNTGLYDFLIGKSYYEIAAYGRSQHKSQEQGGLEFRGDRFAGVNLIESSVRTPEKETSMFDGLDTSVKGIQELIGTSETPLQIELDKLDALLAKALADFDPIDPARISGTLAEAYSQADKVYWSTRQPEAKFLMDDLKKDLAEAIRLASGIRIDFLSESETVTVMKRKSFLVSVKVFLPKTGNVSVKQVRLDAPDWWLFSERWEPEATNRFREPSDFSQTYSFGVPSSQENSQPYFLRKSREGYLYHWENDGNQNLPFQPALVTALVTIDVNGTEIVLKQPLEYRFAHPTRGELRRELNVVPALSIDLDQHLLVVSQSAREEVRKVALRITSHTAEALVGKVKLTVPEGWRANVASDSFQIGKEGESMSIDCEITIPANTRPGSYRISAEAEVGDEKFSQTMNTVAYDHIQTHRYYTDAEATVAVMDLKVAGLKVGYVAGSGDAGPDALRQMGLDVDELDKKALTSGDLSAYDTIVIGIRASEVNPDYVANNGRLLDYVRSGGTMIVQYQKAALIQQNLVPFPATMASRVAEEDAQVTILEPQHPVFNSPNAITQADFQGWVQERNLYSFRSFDERYTPLLESHDTGEPENNGGMVYAKIGKGQYVYTSYAFFRQLPAGVPGAWRLWANLVSLGAEK